MRKILFLLAAVFPLFFCSCGMRSESFFAMDTYITVKANGIDKKLLEELKSEVYADENRFSKTFATSEVYKFNNSVQGVEVSSETAELIAFALEISEKTHGNFSPVLGSLCDLWNINSENPRVPDDAEIAAALEVCKIQNITVSENTVSKTNPDTKIDLGGIAKGYTAERCIKILKDGKAKDALVSFGSSVACTGHSDGKHGGWNIGIKNPFNTSEIIGSVRLYDSCLGVSGAYERYFIKDGERYHHILSSKTGYPARSDIESTAVISKSGALADALSTALFVMGKEKAFSLYKSGIFDFEAVLIMQDGNVYTTKGLEADFEFNSSATDKHGNNLVYNKTK